MTESQTVLQPELINRLDSKIMYLGQLQSAIMAHQIPQIYELIDSQQFNEQIRQRAYADSNASLAQMVVDIHNELATFLAPELIHYLKAHFQFLVFEAIDGEPAIYQVFIGDWWNHRQIGTLDVLALTLEVDQKMMLTLHNVSQLPDGVNNNDNQVREIKQIMTGLQAFLDDETKRKLEVQVIEDQLAQLKENKSGLLGRTDKKAREELENKRELLLASQQRVPEVKEKLQSHQAEILKLEKDDAIHRLELEQILTYFDSVKAFGEKISHLYVDYLNALLQKK